MQHELFVNPQRAARRTYPLVVALHADIALDSRCIVAPLVRRADVEPLRSPLVTPPVRYEGGDYVVMLTMIATLPTKVLRQPVGSIGDWRDDITRGLDWLLWGI